MKPETPYRKIHATADLWMIGTEEYGNRLCSIVEDMPRAGYARPINERLHELVFAARPLTAEEWAELEAVEKATGGDHD